MCRFRYECFVLVDSVGFWRIILIIGIIILTSIYNKIHQLILSDCKISWPHPKCWNGRFYVSIKDRKQRRRTQADTAAPSWYRICQTASSASIFLSLTIDSIDLWRCGPCWGQSWVRLHLWPTSRRCQRTRCAAEWRTRRGGKDTRAKSELEKHNGELEGRRRRRRSRRRRRRGGGGGGGGGVVGGGRGARGRLVNGARTCGEKHSARQALKLHSKAAGVKQCQSCKTHRTHLSPKRVRETWHPNQMLALQKKIHIQ